MPRFHPGCWAWEGWDPVLRIWDNPVPAISETANFISDPVAGSAWIPLDRILPSLSGAETVTGHWRDRKMPILSWALRVQLDYSWNCLGCFEVVKGWVCHWLATCRAEFCIPNAVCGGWFQPSKEKQTSLGQARVPSLLLLWTLTCCMLLAAQTCFQLSCSS